jgi:hypothetical protein
MMKTVPPLKKTMLSTNLFTWLATSGLVIIINCSATASGMPPSSSCPGADTIHSIQVNKSQSSKKHKIRLYPDARQQVLFFSANGEDGKVYQLYLFDMDGRLVSQTRIRNRETTVLTNISEGNFVFEVFTDDERIENGSLVIK